MLVRCRPPAFTPRRERSGVARWRRGRCRSGFETVNVPAQLRNGDAAGAADVDGSEGTFTDERVHGRTTDVEDLRGLLDSEQQLARGGGSVAVVCRAHRRGPPGVGGRW